MREIAKYITTLAVATAITSSYAFTSTGPSQTRFAIGRREHRLRAVGAFEFSDHGPFSRWKRTEAYPTSVMDSILSKPLIDSKQVHAQTNEASQVSQLKKISFQWGIPLLGAALGAAFADPISSSLFNRAATKGINVATIMFLGGFGGAIADALDDDGIWIAPEESSPLNKICPTILQLALHFGTFFSAVFTSTWSNPVPFAMLSAMYSYAVLVRGKAVPDFDKKRGEATIITLCLLPLFGMIGARMATSSLYTRSLIASFFSTFLWLKKVKNTDFFQNNPQLTSAVTSSGIFRALPLLAMAPFGTTTTLLTGMAAFFMDNLGYRLAKFCSLSSFRNKILKYGMAASGVVWSSTYAAYGILKQYPFSFPTVSYNLTWEIFFSLEKTIFASGKLGIGAIAPLLWFLLDLTMVLRCEGLFSRGALKLFGVVSSSVAVLLSLRKKGIIDDRFSNDFKYSSFLTAIYLLIESKMMLAADPTNALKKYACFGIALGNILGAVRSIWRVNTKNLKYSYWMPVIVACMLQGGVEIGRLAVGL